MSDRNGAWWFHRKLWENPLFYGDGITVAVWCWLLSEACWTGRKEIIFKGERITLKKGQLTCGRNQISTATGFSSSQVRRVLAQLKYHQQIHQQSDNKKSLITVLNWEKYQKRLQQNHQLAASNPPATRQQPATTEERKKERKKEITVTNVTVQNQDIVKILEIFVRVNPAIGYGNTTERKAAAWLVEKLGLEKAIATAEAAIQCLGEKYAPTITTPYQLKNNLTKLAAFFARKQGGGAIQSL